MRYLLEEWVDIIDIMKDNVNLEIRMAGYKQN